MKTISVVTPCFNEEGNVREVYERVRSLMLSLGKYRYEHIFIDNASRDTTFAVLTEIAASDPNVKVIRNARNFGHVRSPMHAILQARGDAVIVLMSDLQDPPEVFAQLLEQWEKGVPIVIAVKHREPRIRTDVSRPEDCFIGSSTGSPTTLKLTRTSLASGSTIGKLST